MLSSHKAKPENPTDRSMEILDRLRQAALRITGKSLTAHERAMIQMIAGLDNSSPVLQVVDQYAEVDAETPPCEIVTALRSPAGAQQVVSTRVAGQPLKVVINPLGRVDPDREAAVWQCLVDLVEEHAA